VPARPLDESRAVCVTAEGSWADTESRRRTRRSIHAVIAWARRAGFYNIAGELQDALLLLPGKDEALTAEMKPTSTVNKT
jgi:hypothetical protein